MLWGERHSRDELQQHIERSALEVVVILEGIDPLTGCTVQARHSYVGAELLWDHEFVPCVSRGPIGSGLRAVVDFDRLHQTRPAGCHAVGGSAASHGTPSSQAWGQETNATVVSHS